MQQYTIYDYLSDPDPVVGSKLIDKDGVICYLSSIGPGGYIIQYPDKTCLCPLPAFKYFYRSCPAG